MSKNNYYLKPTLKTIKQGMALEDANGKIVCEAKMLKFKWFTASPYDFINNITNSKEEHKIGKTVTLEETGAIGFFSRKSSFKYDGKNIWDYLHEKGIRINSSMQSGKIGMTYDISFEGNEIATITSSSPKGKSLITTDMYYDITCDEKDLDLVFLVAFAIAKTEQLIYD